MKKLLFVLLSVLSFSSVAQLYTASGAIHSVRVHHMSEPTRNFLLLHVVHEFTNAGNCKVNSDGHVILNVTDERMLQVAITAKVSSRGVTVGFDDDYPDDDGNCTLKWIDL
ncbi:hypothetical protein CAG58_00810 [Vibrio sp. V31_P5A7T61]|uniref:hypothetical protein n=1 Tax=unclassified Vibrio TaxID=2614977 RepID=UPI001372F877|nr:MULTISPECIES: hypothetical protein [unclassified Vibrio]NAW60509.1 hypothetical protein [Vibrio sp. V31_P5A7T61]NAX02119.1 hypothetical protein [Vibrio sp. V34_P3A8T189]NAX64061.1 hypothetical protein [Vibrio sp. V32_P6A28T40]